MEKEIKSVKELYNHVLKVASCDDFLKNYGVNHEVPFFICPYKSAWKFEVEDSAIPMLVKELEQRGVAVLHLNLYDIATEILKESEALDTLIEMEKDSDKAYFLENLQPSLDVCECIIPKIKDEVAAAFAEKEKFVLFLSGVGEVFPYIRAHTLLNNLQSVIKDFPLILFFPGTYETSPENGYSLRLFNRLPADNYYRAYNILNYKV